MNQFDLYANSDKDSQQAYPYFVDIQHALLNPLNSRVVIPLTLLTPSDKSYPEHLCPVINIKHKKYVLLTHQLTSVPVSFLKKNEISLSDHRNVIVAAIDFLATGI
jgi:toxin CcdB